MELINRLGPSLLDIVLSLFLKYQEEETERSKSGTAGSIEVCQRKAAKNLGME